MKKPSNLLPFGFHPPCGISWSMAKLRAAWSPETAFFVLIILPSVIKRYVSRPMLSRPNIFYYPPACSIKIKHIFFWLLILTLEEFIATAFGIKNYNGFGVLVYLTLFGESKLDNPESIISIKRRFTAYLFDRISPPCIRFLNFPVPPL